MRRMSAAGGSTRQPCGAPSDQQSMSNWLLSPGVPCPPFPFAPIVGSSVFGFQLAKSQAALENVAHSEPVERKVTDRYRVAWPLYVLYALSEIFALPSMK